VAHVAHAQLDQVAGAQLAVDPQVEQGKVAQAALHLEPDPNCPDLPELERPLLADELALLPSSPMCRGTNPVHGDLLSVEGDLKLPRVTGYTSVSPSGTSAIETDGRNSKSDPFLPVAIF
jgi:hypothetical protein